MLHCLPTPASFNLPTFHDAPSQGKQQTRSAFQNEAILLKLRKVEQPTCMRVETNQPCRSRPHAYACMLEDAGHTSSASLLERRLTMRFGSTAKVLLKCKLKYYRISECGYACLARSAHACMMRKAGPADVMKARSNNSRRIADM